MLYLYQLTLRDRHNFNRDACHKISESVNKMGQEIKFAVGSSSIYTVATTHLIDKSSVDK